MFNPDMKKILILQFKNNFLFHKSKTNTMKKLLLSSIIMLGICSFVTAQNATDAKSKKLAPAATATPQKSAVATQQNVITNADGTVVAPAATGTVAPTESKATATDAEMAKKKEAAGTNTDAAPQRNNQKIAAEKAAANKKAGN